MAQAIRAIYEDGHLRLLDPVELTEGDQVSISFLTEREATLAVLDDMLAPASQSDEDDDFNDQEAMRLIREELRLAGYPPASQYIIEERREGP